MVICKKVVYSGHVQGVGFRYTAHRLAAGLQVTGYVKNLPSRQVELVVEGETEQVDGFLARLAEQMSGSIRNADIADLPPQDFRGFSIRH